MTCKMSSTDVSPLPPSARVIFERAKVKGFKKVHIAKVLNVSRQSLTNLCRRGVPIPTNKVIPIFEITGITPHQQRPDIYPNPSDGISNRDIIGHNEKRF